MCRIVKTDMNCTYLNPNLYKWRRVMLVFIPKVGGRVVILPKSFGQISLTSFLLKTMEKAVDHQRLIFYTQDNMCIGRADLQRLP